MKGEGQFPEEIIRRVSKTVLHAAERGRQSLFERLTAASSDKIAQISAEKPIFYESKEDAEKKILLDDEIAQAFPPDFYENPTAWIESQSAVNRGDLEEELPSGETIAELWSQPYDITKVKEFVVGLPNKKEKLVISKRIEPDQLGEIATARKAYEAGIPTPKVLGEVLDRGNVYVLFEHISGINLNAAWWRLYKEGVLKHPSAYHNLSYIFNQKEFESQLRKEVPEISKSRFERILHLWQEARPLVLRREILADLVSNILEWTHEEMKKRFHKMLAAGRFMGMEKDVIEVLRSLGYASLDEYISSIPSTLKEKEVTVLKIKDLAKMPELEIFEAQLVSEIHTEIFGFDYEAEIEHLKKLCDQKDIKHKDLAPRNMVIPWDFERGRPLPPEPGRPKLYIIDWEG